MHILSIDSTTKKLTVNLSKDRKVISGISDSKCLKHMEKIMTHIDHVIKQGHVGLKDIDVLGINAGPGDFTGTRIGISVIKTLSWVLDKPAYGINALDVFALGIIDSNARYIDKAERSGIPVIILPCLDVRKEELYYSFYKITGDKKSTENKDKYRPISEIEIGNSIYQAINISSNHLIQKNQFNKNISELFKNGDLFLPDRKNQVYRNARVILGGNCLHSYKEMLSSLANDNERVILDKKNTEPSGINLIECIDFQVKNKKMPDRINPVYVREFIPFGK